MIFRNVNLEGFPGIHNFSTVGTVVLKCVGEMNTFHMVSHMVASLM